MVKVDSRDKDGHFCGQNATTGEMEPTPENLVGFCGPDCVHCMHQKVYAVQNNVWVCAADYDYDEVTNG